MNESFRLGIDFGYAYTGIALLNSGNKVLDYKVLKHRNDLSDALEKRRSIRGQRRRKLSKTRRLRDFYALLKGMGIEPRHAKPKEKSSWKEKASLGNRLYALAHYRGWDYASLLEMLISWQDEDKSPSQPPIVKEIDNILIQEFGAPVEFKERQKGRGETEAEYKKSKEDAWKEFNKNSRFREDQRFSSNAARFVCIKGERTCLGELWQMAKEVHALRKKLERSPTAEIENRLTEREGEYRSLLSRLKESGVEEIVNWIEERLALVYESASLESDMREQIVLRIMTMLGLRTGERLFEEGKIYRPHRNRHRDEMLGDLQRMMKVACGLTEDSDFQECLDETFLRLKKSNLNANKEVLFREEVEQDWRQSIEAVHQKAGEIARKTGSSPEKVKEKWVKASQKIVNRAYRKKRFENRNSMGKCPAKIDDGCRCNRNVPKKHKENIRKLQFEIELRQMNVKRHGEDIEKLSEGEVKEIMTKLIFKKKPEGEAIRKNSETIKGFFTGKKGNRYVPPAENESRGKKEILKDIACGEQSGRAGFCIHHLQEKLQLLKDGETQGEKWKRLHEERILTLRDDAPPSIRQKVQKVIGVVRQMLREQGVSDINNPPIEHVGIETARFDINLLAQDEGKRLKKKLKPKRYQQSAGGDKPSLIEDQGGRCIFCGDLLFADAHIDHLFPKGKGGGNIALNKVVGHSICNINKHKKAVPLSGEVLDSIKEKNRNKYDFIRRRLETDGRLPQDMLDAPQHTMFGAKLLQGAFADEFNLTSQEIRKIRAADASYLRRFWFPFMNRQKQALRQRFGFKAEAGKEWQVDIEKLKLDQELFSGKLEISRLNKGENWLEINKRNGKAVILGIPKPAEAGGNQFLIKDNNSNQLVMEVERIVEEERKLLDRFTMKLGQPMKLPLKDIFSRDKGIKELLKSSDVAVQVEFWKKDKDLERDWLRVEEGELVGTPAIYLRDNLRSYVPWCDMRITNKATGEVLDKVEIKNYIAERVLHVTVEPEKDDPIREFHHAIDAVVLAADVDWEGMNRLHKDTREWNYRERKRANEQARKENAPVFGGSMRQDKKGNLLAPERSSSWYIEDKRKQDSPESSWTDLEPLRIAGASVIQRKPMDSISKKNIKNIQSDEIKKAMSEAWEEIDSMEESEKKKVVSGSGNDQTISQYYFLSLDENHILNPQRTRSVLCKVEGAGPRQMFFHKDRKTGGHHKFKRAVPWQKVEVIRYKDNRGREKVSAVRFASQFYWKDKGKPQYERNEVDQELPRKYETLAIFRRGDLVEVTGKNGKWKIAKLGESATISNAETQEEATSSYRKLTKVG